MEHSNQATIARLGDTQVQTLSGIPSPALEDLAKAGLPLLGLLD
jgi:hypothetical protein